MLLLNSSPLTITFYHRKPFSSNALILHHSFSLTMSPSSSFCLSVQPIFTNSFTCTLTHSPNQMYVYPDPIPEFAESVSTCIFPCKFAHAETSCYLLIPLFEVCCRRARSSKLNSFRSFPRTWTSLGMTLMRLLPFALRSMSFSFSKS